MGGFISGFGNFINAVGPTTADLLKAFNPTTINYAPAAQTPGPAPIPVTQGSQSQNSLAGELVIAAIVGVAAILIYREFAKQHRK
jgi:hypothetical protein